MDNYEFQFHYLPNLLREDNEVNMLRSIANLTLELELDNKSYDIDDISIIHTMRRGIEDFLILFNKSDNRLEAIYCLVVLYQHRFPLYFTLERGELDTNVILCRMDIANNTHYVLEPFMAATSIETFKDKVYSYISANEEILIDLYD